jgi:hypothetical protein
MERVDKVGLGLPENLQEEDVDKLALLPMDVGPRGVYSGELEQKRKEPTPKSMNHCEHKGADAGLQPKVKRLEVVRIITFPWSGSRGLAGYTEAHASAWHVCGPVLSDP